VRRLKAGGSAIDRDAPLTFRFDGREYEGFAGDTLASALLANGVDVVCLSPILRRPRGVMSAGVEEASAFVEVTAPWPDPIAAATTIDLVDGLMAGGRPGVGRLPGPDAPARPCEHRYAHVETLVIGAGDAGLEAASGSATRRASDRDDRVLLVDAGPITDRIAWYRTMGNATALGVYDRGFVVIHERGGPVERLWHVRAERVVLATGAHERPIAFADCDRPGVMLADAVRRYIGEFGVLPGERAVIFTTNDSTAGLEELLLEVGAEVAAVVDARLGDVVTAAHGHPRVGSVTVRDADGTERTVGCDLVAVSGGWNPVTQLWRAIGGGLAYDEQRACFVPDGDGPPWLEVVGAAAGEGLPSSSPLWFSPAEDLSLHYVDLQRDQTVADVLDEVAGGLRSVEHVKRATYIGTAIDQGRTSGVLTAEIVNGALGWEPGAQGPTNARPPSAPVSFAALAGPYRYRMLDPERRTPIHPWHVENGAVFENVGQWKRPWYFPGADESMKAAVLRECGAVRTGVGVMDASTLGKIEIAGPDAAAFLDRMYTNRMSTLPPGRIRYGLLCGVDGMVFDDGVAMRLTQNRFLVTTTTGGAAKVLDHFEEWLQTEWPELRAYCTSVTEQWATIAINGPRSREVVAAAGTEVDLAASAFPFMTWRNGVVAGMPARIARVSFSGELAYEINVPSWYGRAMWEAVMAAGEELGIVPYGTEAMHVLRAEKGFPIVGQDTDGTVTPHDLGMSWIVRRDDSDFVGRRSLRRADATRADRKHLVGLLPAEPDVLLPEGAQIVLDDTGRIPMPMAGHVTSSYPSAALGRTFALAMIVGGRALIDRTVYAPLPERTIAARVTQSVFWDPDGERRDG
jgi:sarcosine oxidase, subunit alpha